MHDIVVGRLTSLWGGLLTASLWGGLLTASLWSGLLTASLWGGLLTASLWGGLLTAPHSRGVMRTGRPSVDLVAGSGDPATTIGGIVAGRLISLWGGLLTARCGVVS